MSHLLAEASFPKVHTAHVHFAPEDAGEDAGEDEDAAGALATFFAAAASLARAVAAAPARRTAVCPPRDVSAFAPLLARPAVLPLSLSPSESEALSVVALLLLLLLLLLAELVRLVRRLAASLRTPTMEIPTASLKDEDAADEDELWYAGEEIG